MLLSVDRYLSIKIMTWSNKFNPKQAFMASFAAVFIILAINTNVLIKYGYEADLGNGTSQVFCFYLPDFPDTFWMSVYNKVRVT